MDNDRDWWNLDYYDSDNATRRYQIPTLKRTDFIPDGLMGFKYMLADRSKGEKKVGIHFFLDDYQFERIWNKPWRYTPKLRQYQCVLTPDFSLYMDMPLAVKIANVYRSRLIGQMLQREGLTVIPSLQYAGMDTYEFAFDGIEPGGVVATSTVGILKYTYTQEIWKAGMDEAIRQLCPSTVLVYGSKIDYDWKDTKHIYFPLAYRRWGQAHEDWVEKGGNSGQPWSK